MENIKLLLILSKNKIIINKMTWMPFFFPSVDKTVNNTLKSHTQIGSREFGLKIPQLWHLSIKLGLIL